MSAARRKPAPAKPHYTIGTIGAAGHGKRTLTAAITHVLARAGLAESRTHGEIAKAPVRRKGGMTFRMSRVAYETEACRYTHVSWPAYLDYFKAMTTGAVRLDLAVLVVDVTLALTSVDEPEFVYLAAEMDVPEVVVYLSKADRIEDRGGTGIMGMTAVEMAEWVVSGLGLYLGGPEYRLHDRPCRRMSDVPVIDGSALAALEDGDNPLGRDSVLELMSAIDHRVAQPVPPRDLPFLMAVEDSAPRRGAVAATGRIERGVVEAGQEVEVVGMGETASAVCAGVEASGRRRRRGEAGETLACILRGVDRGAVKRGRVLAAPGTMTAHPSFSCDCHILAREDGSRYGPFLGNERLRFCLRAAVVKGAVTKEEDLLTTQEELAREFDWDVPMRNIVTMRVELSVPVAIDVGERLSVREGRRIVGSGYVTRVHEEDPINPKYPRGKWGYRDWD